MIALRRTVKYSLFAVYVVFCPLLILHALGIMIKPKEKTIMQATGLISVKTAPSNALVYLSGVLQPEKTPMLIRNLPEGDYEIRVERLGYRPWDKTVSVRKNFATAHERIILIPTLVHPLAVVGLTTADKIVGSTASWILVSRGTTLGEIMRITAHDLAFETATRRPTTPLVSPTSLDATLPITEIIPLAGSEMLIAVTKKEGQPAYLLLDASATTADPTDITELCIKSPDEFLWDPREPSALLYRNDERIDRIDIKKMAVFTHCADHAMGAGLSGRTLFVLDKNGFVSAFDTLKELDNTAKARSIPSQAKIPSNERCRIYALSDTILLFRSSKGALYSNLTATPLVDSGVRGIIEDRDRKAVIYWTADEIGVVVLQKSAPENNEEDRIKRVRLVTGGRDIMSVSEADRGSHLLYVDGERVMFAEADIREPRTVELTTTNGPAVYLDRHGRLFLTQSDGLIATVTVVPERSMFNLALPEFDEEYRYE